MPDDQVKNTIAVYDEIADEYAVSMNNYTPDVEREKFEKFIIPSGAILDLGCAAGRDSIYFSSKGFHTVGVDLSEKLLSIAKHEAPTLTFLHQDVRHLDFPEASFDGIWACAIFLHLTRDEAVRAIQSCVKLLKSNGMIFIMLKVGKGEKDIAEQLSSGATRHFTLFESQELEDIVTTAGLKIIENYTWNSKDRYTPIRDVEWISCFAKKYYEI